MSPSYFMWGYFGAKTNVIDAYPKTKHDLIIEPFAGSARYALKYWEKDVLLVDKYPIVINIWKWLQNCSTGDIKRLPHFFNPGQSVNDFDYDCEEAKHLIGFLIGFGMSSPRITASKKRMQQRPNHINFSLNRIENNLFKIKHWKIIEGSYIDIENKKATWFIDPPYQFGGHVYKHGNKLIDFDILAYWCKQRNGQVMVCENTHATWMDFIPISTQKTSNGFQREVIWTNEPTIFNNIQQTLTF